VLPVGLKAYWSRNMSGGKDGKIHLRTMIFSVSLLMSGVTDIGRKSENPVGLGTLGTGVTKKITRVLNKEVCLDSITIVEWE